MVSFSLSIFVSYCCAAVHLTVGISRCISQGNELDTSPLSEKRILQRCVTPIELLLEGRFRPGIKENDFEIPTPPPWFNVTLATLGQKFVAKYHFNVVVSTLVGGTAFAALKDLAETLFYTGGAEKAARALTSNMMQTDLWYKEDLFGPKSNMMESLNAVRSLHLVALAKMSARDKQLPVKAYKLDHDLWTVFGKDLKMSNLKHRTIPEIGVIETPYAVNQYGMALGLWCLTALPIIRPTQFGFPDNAVTNEELEGFIHFFAYIGHALGTEDEFNICLQPNLAAAKIYFERMLKEHIVPTFFNLSYESKVFTESSARGFREAIGPEVQFDFILRRILEDMIGIPCPNLANKMTPLGRIGDTFWRYFLNPGVRHSRTIASVTNFMFNGYMQNLNLKLFGFDGTNKTIVAEKGFTW